MEPSRPAEGQDSEAARVHAAPDGDEADPLGHPRVHDPVDAVGRVDPVGPKDPIGCRESKCLGGSDGEMQGIQSAEGRREAGNPNPWDLLQPQDAMRRTSRCQSSPSM